MICKDELDFIVRASMDKENVYASNSLILAQKSNFDPHYIFTLDFHKCDTTT